MIFLRPYVCDNLHCHTHLLGEEEVSTNRSVIRTTASDCLYGAHANYGFEKRLVRVSF